MHGETSDSYCLAHAGPRCARCTRPAGTRSRASTTSRSQGRGHGDHSQRPSPEALPGPRGALRQDRRARRACCTSTPGFEAEHFDMIARHVKGIVVAGTGLGHVSEEIVGSDQARGQERRACRRHDPVPARVPSTSTSIPPAGTCSAPVSCRRRTCSRRRPT